MKVGYYSPAFLEKQARALVTMEVLWRADPDLWEPGRATAPATRQRFAIGCRRLRATGYQNFWPNL